MEKKAVLAMMLTLLLIISMLTVAYNIHIVKSDWTWTETIYIRADGSVDPDTAPISTVDNVTYTLTDNIVGDVPRDKSAIVVERSNIILDGKGYMVQGGYTVQGTEAIDSEGICLTFVTNTTIWNVKIKRFFVGIKFYYASNNSIYANNILNNGWACFLTHASGNDISANNITTNTNGILARLNAPGNNIYENNITNNLNFGLELEFDSQNVSRNNISNNGGGIYLKFSDGHRICGNTFEENQRLPAIQLGYSYDNLIFHNTFVDNKIQASGVSPNNSWDDGYPSGGNYWSDYTGVDADGDGIGDTPYVIDENNQDRYPLMGQAQPFGLPIDPTVFYALIVVAVAIAAAVAFFMIRRRKKLPEEIESP